MTKSPLAHNLGIADGVVKCNVADKTDVTDPATDDAAAWDGWGTATKPAMEPLCLARKPLSEKTVAANVLKWGTGALNINGCRVAYVSDEDKTAAAAAEQRSRQTDRNFEGWGMREQDLSAPAYMSGSAGNGRWPANVCHDGSEEVVGQFPDAPGALRAVGPEFGAKIAKNTYCSFAARDEMKPRGDSGSGARFFYCAKATTADRDDGLLDLQLQRHIAWQTGNGASGKPSSISEGRNTQRRNTHPTVKPTALMQWLVRLVTPPCGTVLDPFMGTGSTGRACALEGFDFIGIEREATYVELALLRIAAAERKTPAPTLADLFANLPFPEPAKTAASAYAEEATADRTGERPECNEAHDVAAKHDDGSVAVEAEPLPARAETEQSVSAQPVIPKDDDFEIPAFLRRVAA